MKTIEIKNAYPGFANGFVTYEGVLNTEAAGNYGIGYSEYRIYTEIKNNLCCLIFACEVYPATRDTTKTNFPTGIAKTFLLSYKTEKDDNDNCVVVVRVPYGCNASYKVSGEKNIQTYLNEKNIEVVETEAGFDDGYAGYSHKHDGIDSSKISLANIKPTPGNANKFVKVSSDGSSFIYEDVSGAPGAFALTSPINNAVLDMGVASTLFNWGDSAGATSYIFVVTNEITDETVVSVSGIGVSQYTLAHSSLAEGQSYEWNVIATNGTETTSSIPRRFRTNIITEEGL